MRGAFLVPTEKEHHFPQGKGTESEWTDLAKFLQLTTVCSHFFWPFHCFQDSLFHIKPGMETLGLIVSLSLHFLMKVSMSYNTYTNVVCFSVVSLFCYGGLAK